MKKNIFKILIYAIAFVFASQTIYAAVPYVECEQGTLYVNGRIELGEQQYPVNVTVTGYDPENNLNYIDIITAGTDGVAQFRYKNLGKSGKYTYVFDADTINVTKTVELSGFIGFDYWDIFVSDINTLAKKGDDAGLKTRFFAENGNLVIDTTVYDTLEDKSEVFKVMLKDYTTYSSADEVVKAYNRAVTLCNFNENKTVEKFMAIYNSDKENGYFGIWDKLPRVENGTVLDCLGDIKSTVISEYIKETFEKSSDIVDKLKVHVLLDAIKYADHYGIIKNLIQAYNTSGYISVTIDEYIDSVCKELVNNNLSSLTNVENTFENYRQSIIDSSYTPSKGSGGSGKGNSSGLITGVPIVQVDSLQESLQPIDTKTGLNKGEMYFTDMEDAKWGLEAVNNLYQKNILHGIGDNKFAPHKNVSRAEMAKLISSVAGLNAGTDVHFGDVDKNEWYYPYVSAVFANSIFVGKTENNFGVYDSITRQEAAVAIYRLVKSRISEISGQQENLDENYKDLANIFDTGDSKPVYEATYDDGADVADWATEAVYALKESGIMTGRSGNTFAPNDTLTRVEAAVLCNAIYKYFEEGNA